MKIHKIHIQNFRGFEDKTFHLDDHVTVVVGNNTTGKTSLLKAIQVALGAYLKALTLLPSDKPYRMNFTQSDVFVRYNPEKRDFFPNPDKTRVEVEATAYPTIADGGTFRLENRPIGWWRELRGNKTTHSHECAGQLIEFVNEMERMRTSANADTDAIMPLVLSFGVNRIDNNYRGKTKSKKHDSRLAKAYRAALLETVDFRSAFNWLYKFDSNLAKDKEFAGTKEAFIHALEQAIPAMSQIEIDTKNDELLARIVVTGQEPEFQSFDNMSDGFKAMICIVAEIAYRCIELNGFLGEQAVRMTPGIVVIDELDLYLHPHWQRHVLADLQRAFPLIQFVVSSHSPFIIQSVESRNVITLDGIKGETDPNMRSIEEIVVTEMDMDTPRSEKFNTMVEAAEEYYNLVKEGKNDTAEGRDVKRRLDQIEAEFSDDPAYVALLKVERSANEAD